MKVVLPIIALAAIASARPDVSHLPSRTYVPSNTYLPSSESDDQKHIYFYASPNDKHYTNFRINVVPKSHKNTKIIFVKAPHHTGVIPEVIAPPSLAEDKTLVYVLVKKPIESQSISIPSGLGIKQVKPEVFFLNYNNKHDAQNQISSGIQGNPVGTNVAHLENEHAFLGTLGNGHDHGSNGHSGVSGYDGSAKNHGPIGGSGPY